jgi:N-acetylglucosaminyl-diphospho-decaprenol L-rhamnosyltransferase
MSRPAVSLISVTYRSAEPATEMLRSVAADGWINADGSPTSRGEIIVVDSGSGDDTVSILRSRFAALNVQASEQNVGFGRGSNLGAAAASGDFLAFVNPDVLLPPGVLASLQQYLEGRPRVAIAGPAIVDGAGRPSIATQRFPSLPLELKRQWAGLLAPLGWSDRGDRAPCARGPVDWVSGACLVIRREVFEQLGGFDPTFFLYYEETDLCRRVIAAGHEVHHLPDLSVVHDQGACAKAADGQRHHGRLEGPFRASRRHYFRKHHGRAVATAVEWVHGVRSFCQGLRPRSSR